MEVLITKYEVPIRSLVLWAIRVRIRRHDFCFRNRVDGQLKLAPGASYFVISTSFIASIFS